ncbi:MAG: response regulator [Verrucomicrobiae bacterium]|nr:response regulator [Verrucomicrobiae bacterium]
MILIVEDNEENAAFLKIFVERKGGWPCAICTQGDRIVELCQSGAVRLVIMDIQLHNTFFKGNAVSGVALARHLKTDPSTAGIPILLATAHALKDEQTHFLAESLADGYITKPIEDLHDLLGEIQRLVPAR